MWISHCISRWSRYCHLWIFGGSYYFFVYKLNVSDSTPNYDSLRQRNVVQLLLFLSFCARNFLSLSSIFPWTHNWIWSSISCFISYEVSKDMTIRYDIRHEGTTIFQCSSTLSSFYLHSHSLQLLQCLDCSIVIPLWYFPLFFLLFILQSDRSCMHASNSLQFQISSNLDWCLFPPWYSHSLRLYHSPCQMC